MYDITAFPYSDAAKWGFKKFLYAADVPIKKIKNIKEGVKYRNKRVLLLPESYFSSEGAIKNIAEKKRAVLLFNLRRIIEKKGVERAKEIKIMRRCAQLCVKHNCYYALCTLAKEEKELRTYGELCNLALLIGFNRGQAKFGIKRNKII